MINITEPVTVVKSISPSVKYPENQSIHQASEIPPRSRLYNLAPCGIETMWAECLTSYTNRLGWMYRVPPKALVAQEIVPLLGRKYPHQFLGTCCRGIWFMNVNGNGSIAQDWSTILEQLTLHSHIHLLTLHWWLGDLSSRGHLRAAPAWCPACYDEWREQGNPIYQPLLWMVRVVTTCLKHKRRLEDYCPHCQKKQSVITLQTSPGHCTQCNIWLGTTLNKTSSLILDDETIEWQVWVVRSLEELYVASSTSGPLSWKAFFASIAFCMKENGMSIKLTQCFYGNRTNKILYMDQGYTCIHSYT